MSPLSDFVLTSLMSAVSRTAASRQNRNRRRIPGEFLPTLPPPDAQPCAVSSCVCLFAHFGSAPCETRSVCWRHRAVNTAEGAQRHGKARGVCLTEEVSLTPQAHTGKASQAEVCRLNSESYPVLQACFSEQNGLDFGSTMIKTMRRQTVEQREGKRGGSSLQPIQHHGQRLHSD
uniref:Uncharacterized protein n=1 Tax=Knipowitschia caucasica TaxID=637954 RepID=A0AAV2IYN6_KNICA